MAANDFFSRWAKKKTPETSEEPVSRNDAPQTPVAPEAGQNDQPAPPRPLPTFDDVDRLTPQSDYTAFMANGVDENVRRSAMKKLFTDPHFNIMDGLDIYIDDYTKPDPIPPAMLAMLEHAKSVLNPLQHLESSSMRMIGAADEASSTGRNESDAEPTARTETPAESLAEAEANQLPQDGNAVTEARESPEAGVVSPAPCGEAASGLPEMDQPAPQADPEEAGRAADSQPRQS